MSGISELNWIDGEPIIEILDKCENRLDGYNKIVPVNTIESIKKKEELGFDNEVCDDLRGPSKKTNGGLIIDDGKYDDTHKLTIGRSDVNRVEYCDDEGIVTNNLPDRNKVE
ncbi:12803_t:CDS:2 [Acaulospora morrowiae]|uniref:12803_t:CDS:1 n=1 Tax=Acaulospora morrowiae TaxID=94023 RepID=A0A9N9B7T7_9GLOM|nr:12803_t:CDS:2 [Acaulospora morrowiae]